MPVSDFCVACKLLVYYHYVYVKYFPHLALQNKLTVVDKCFVPALFMIKGKIMKKYIYQTAYELLSSGMKIVLAKIIRRTGSTPRNVGAMCIVTPDEVFGTVGGGLMEHKVISRCRELLDQGQSTHNLQKKE